MPLIKPVVLSKSNVAYKSLSRAYFLAKVGTLVEAWVNTPSDYRRNQEQQFKLRFISQWRTLFSIPSSLTTVVMFGRSRSRSNLRFWSASAQMRLLHKLMRLCRVFRSSLTVRHDRTSQLRNRISTYRLAHPFARSHARDELLRAASAYWKLIELACVVYRIFFFSSH